MSARFACISVDLDSLHHYCRIHGLPESILDTSARGLVYGTALSRFCELFRMVGLQGTFFVVGEDLVREDAAQGIQNAHAAGHEIGNHTYSHDYALTRRTGAQMEEEVGRAAEAITAHTGQRPIGFRAPGYTLTPTLYRVLQQQGYLYDSSVFPAAPYYAAKAAVMLALRIAGRPSRAILDRPAVLAAPDVPYRPDPASPYRRGEGEVFELPAAVTPWLRMPFIGTAAVSLPWTICRAVYQRVLKAPFVNFELHGIDVLDANDGIPEVLVKRQRELLVPHPLKMSRLYTLFSQLARSHDLVTLAVAARALSPRRGPG